MTEQQPPIYVNGRFLPPDAPAVSALDRGLTLADGVFETMVATKERIFRLESHLARLANSASLLALELPPSASLADALQETLSQSGLQRAVLRLTVTRGIDLGRGVPIRPGLSPTVIIRVTPLAPPAPAPTSLHTCSFSRNELSPVASAKTLAYTEMVAAWAEAHRAGADDALLLNTQGNVAGATTSNVFIVTGNVIITPDLEQGVLPGIARATILALARDLGMEAREAVITPSDLQGAHEIFLTNVARGPGPVDRLDGERTNTGGVTTRLANAYWESVG